MSTRGVAEDAARHAWRVIELERVLAAVAGRASSPQGREAVLALRPQPDRDLAIHEMERVEAVRATLAGGEFSGVPTIPEAAGDLHQLGLDGSVLTGSALHRVAVLLSSSRRLRADLEPSAAALSDIRDALVSEPGVEKSIESTVEPDGSVRSGASKELGRIRREMRKVQSELVRALERFMGELPERLRVADASVTIRSGRYVIPVRREGRSAVGGIVHDQSATGATLFMEPPGQIDRMNRLRELELGEGREVHRVLTERTAELRPHGPLLRAALDALVQFDSLYARARTAEAWAAHRPSLVEPETGLLDVVDGRHPLLIEKGGEVVPFSLALDADDRVVVVSGPNTGGKSVLLKAIGLIPALTMAGVVPPVGPGTTVPAFTGFFADIGDEQSIQDDLSTFAAHVANLRTILRGAGTGALVLLDELGTGTDPAEGAALAQAALEHLATAGALTIATSHLGQLKRLDHAGSGMVNASLQFDSDRMEPTYRLVKGRPGRSFGLAIGRRLELPEEVMARAGSLLADDDARQDMLLERLEREERRASALSERLDKESAELATLREGLEDRERVMAERERTAERVAHEESRRILMEARAEVEQAIADAREAAGDADAERKARRRVEEGALRHKEAAKKKEPQRVADENATGLSPGQRVRVASGAQGTIVERQSDHATVELDGGVRMRLPLSSLTAAPDAPVRKGSVRWIESSSDAATEVDLRGLRVDEVPGPLVGALDRAVLADLPSLRIIHGKGTGAVKARVLELIGDDPRVLEFADGREGEGGSGVTVIRLR